ncbi:hypothetical protein L484_022291 [Morus notabilis]|uniref:Uncharacterized protein n=1 Tax=Morus notabilis TaxID=981085 RepID=W9S678_9ROSA|nr:hypothetical protein L484_022291 [Morus notabilis]
MASSFGAVKLIVFALPLSLLGHGTSETGKEFHLRRYCWQNGLLSHDFVRSHGFEFRRRRAIPMWHDDDSYNRNDHIKSTTTVENLTNTDERFTFPEFEKIDIQARKDWKKRYQHEIGVENGEILPRTSPSV